MPGKGFNARVLRKLLRNRPHTIGAEIGVFEGDTSWRLLEWLPGLDILICVDVWEHNEEFYQAMPKKRGRILSADWKRVQAVFKAQVVDRYGDRVWAIKNTSVNAAEIISNGMLDFGFIDGNHDEDHVRMDIYAWWPKIRVGGLLCGDDYRDRPGYGVIQAVDDIFGGRAKNIGRIWYIEKTKEELT